MSYLAGLFLSLAIVANMEWRTDEDLITMAAIVVSSAVLGSLWPRRFLLSGLLLGLVVPAVNVFTLVTGVRPQYETDAKANGHTALFVVSLAVLVLPAIVAACIGRIASTKMPSWH